MISQENKNLVVRVTLKAERKYLPTVTKFVSDIARIKGFPEDEIMKLEGVTEEACLNVIEQSYAAGEEAYFNVSVERRPAQLIVAIEDKGLPFDLEQLQKDQNSGIGLKLIKAFTDEINFINKGREGKRMEFIKNISFSQVEPVLSEETFESVAVAPSKESDDKESAEPLTLRIMKADEGLKLSRLLYRTKSSSYDDDVYYPDRIKAAVLKGTQVSLVVENTKQEFVGHLALIKTDADSKVAECGRIMIDPAYAGRSLLPLLKKQCITLAKKKDLCGVFCETDAVDPQLLHMDRDFGFKACGFAAGDYAKDKTRSKKHPKLLMYNTLTDCAGKKVFAPYHHKTMIERIFANINVVRNINLPLGQMPQAASSSTVLVSKALEELGIGYIIPVTYGSDFTDVLNVKLREMLKDGVNCIYLDLALEDSFAVILCSMVEMLGFFFAGIIPNTAAGDVLRLQYVLEPNMNVDKETFTLPFAKEIVSYAGQTSGAF